MAEGGLPPSAALLAALRRTRVPEPQLTQAIAAVCRTDRRFAAAVAEVLLSAAPASRTLSTLPAELVCEPEVTLRFDGAVPSRRRPKTISDQIDLLFSGPDERWRLLVELKLGSGFQPGQLTWYRRARFERLEQAGLLAVVRHRIGEEVPTERSPVEWCGAVRWSEVVDGLQALAPPDELLAAQWRLLWDVLHDGDELGVFPGEMAAFGRRPIPKGEHGPLRRLAEDLQPAILRGLEGIVARHYEGADGGTPAVGGYGRHGTVASGTKNVVLRFWVGQKAPEGKRDPVLRVRLGLDPKARRRRLITRVTVRPVAGQYRLFAGKAANDLKARLEVARWTTTRGPGELTWFKERAAGPPGAEGLPEAIVAGVTELLDEVVVAGALDREPGLRPRPPRRRSG